MSRLQEGKRREQDGHSHTGGSVSAVALAGGAQASTAANPSAGPEPARSFAELLDPIPNAAAVLEADNAQTAAGSREQTSRASSVACGKAAMRR